MNRAVLLFFWSGLAVACGSFGSAEEAPGPPVPDAAADAGVPDGAARPDAPPPIDGGQGPVPGSFCAVEQAQKVPHVLCTDFESGLTKAWRGSQLRDDVFAIELGTAQLSLGPGKGSPNALRVEAASVGRGTLTTTLMQQPSVRLSFSLFVDKVPGAEGDAAVVALEFGSGERIALRLASTGGSVLVSGAPALALSGVPMLTGSWRRITLDVANDTGRRAVRVAIDDQPVLDDAVADGELPSFPTSVRPHIGVDAAAVPFAWRIDDVTVDPVP